MTRDEIARTMVVVGSEMMTAEQWGIRHRIGIDTMQQRLRCGWSWVRCVTTPVRPHGTWGVSKLSMNGEIRTIREWAKLYGTPFNTVYSRVHDLKWPVHRAIVAPANATKAFKYATSPHRKAPHG
jgi:hypothetical protein